MASNNTSSKIVLKKIGSHEEFLKHITTQCNSKKPQVVKIVKIISDVLPVEDNSVNVQEESNEDVHHNLYADMDNFIAEKTSEDSVLLKTQMNELFHYTKRKRILEENVDSCQREMNKRNQKAIKNTAALGKTRKKNYLPKIYSNSEENSLNRKKIVLTSYHKVNSDAEGCRNNIDSNLDHLIENILIECSICGEDVSIMRYSNHQKIHALYAVSEILKENVQQFSDNYFCVDCKRPFESCDDFTNHLSKNESDLMKCNDCFKTFHSADCQNKKKDVLIKYTCEICNQIFNTFSNLKQHERLHLGDKPYFCNICDDFFSESTDLKEHRNIHLENTINDDAQIKEQDDIQSSSLYSKKREFKCIRCSAIFSTLVEFNVHKKSHYNESFECICGKKFSYIETFNWHRKKCEKSIENLCVSQSNSKSISVENVLPLEENLLCKMCNKEFDSVLSLKEHRKQHFKAKITFCEECFEPFDSVRMLRDHLVTVHEKDLSFKCSVCGKSFAHKSGLNEHKNLHFGIKVPCDICGKLLPNMAKLRLHQTNHTGKKKYNCEICKKGFNELNYFNSHLTVHTGEKNFNCDICGEMFRFQSGLKSHKIMHTGVKNYICETCGKSFWTSRSLTQHTKLHTKLKLYSCRICHKSFKTAVNLRSHEFIHSDLRPYSCDECGKAFKMRQVLNMHKARHKNKLPLICEICSKPFKQHASLVKHLEAHKDGKRKLSVIKKKQNIDW